ncbi:follistatin-related protein 1-like isoform X1 [Haliotis rufescens]|uniref:follistatin-related protein 1-like isoform X1 n=1 Tax=Haliotis rufescens TaxID=6454 RepID=UPI00201ED9A2|nr:follistatin-related protein 1-like isoform X1 [Haliotis rufescens]
MRDCLVFMLVVLVLALSIQSSEAEKKTGGQKSRKCGTKRCRAGQQCSTQPDGQKTCICRKVCSQKKFLMCGSDGRTYYNKCELHRIACVEGRKLKIKHKGACPSNNDVPVNDVEKKSGKQNLPLVCYQVERDELRQLLVDWIKRRVVTEGRTYKATVNQMFLECDQDKNSVLDADEMLQCMEKEGTDVKDTDAHILRGLCIDALISTASVKHNWVLTKPELQHLLEPNFVAPSKECQLEDKKYRDGAETQVDCNVCVCACGDWVCTGAPCGKDKRNQGVPGPVHSGRLPTQEQRERFLRGFKAAKEVYVRAVQDQVANKQHSRDIAQQLDGLNKKDTPH